MEAAEDQGGKCKICLVSLEGLRRCIDHDHETGIVRGILCGPCNTGIGMLRESEFTFQRALAYLEKYNSLKPMISGRLIEGLIRFADFPNPRKAANEKAAPAPSTPDPSTG